MPWPKGKPRKKTPAAPVEEAPGTASIPVMDEQVLETEAETETDDHELPNEPEGAGLVFEVEQAPEDAIPSRKKEGLLDNVFATLGLTSNTPADEQKRAAPTTGKLTKRQQQFFDTFSPMACMGFIVVAGWAWTRLGDEYAGLAPSEEVAAKIVEPLVRIYARNAKFVSSINVNYIDAAASLTALIGYVHTSIRMYQAIKSGELDNAQYASENSHASAGRGRESTSYESGYGRADSGQDAFHGADGSDSGGYGTSYSLNHLTADERRQFEALSLLRKRDYESRLRRSGSARRIYARVG